MSRDHPFDGVQRPRLARATWCVAACGLLAAAVAWPIVDVGPTGGILWRMNTAHGVDTRDLLSLPLLVGAFYAARRAAT